MPALKNLSRISTVLHQTFRTGLVFLSQSKWVQGVVCYDRNLQKRKYLSRISTVLHQTFRTGLIFLNRSKWVQGVVCYNRNLQKCKYLSGISTVLYQTFRTGLIFLSWLKWVQGVVCYDGSLWKHKYLSRTSTVLHETFRTGLIFVSQLKWVQGVVCYDWNLWKHKYLNGDEFPITFKVNYISEDFLPVTVTSRLFLYLISTVTWFTEVILIIMCPYSFIMLNPNRFHACRFFVSTNSQTDNLFNKFLLILLKILAG